MSRSLLVALLVLTGSISLLGAGANPPCDQDAAGLHCRAPTPGGSCGLAIHEEGVRRAAGVSCAATADAQGRVTGGCSTGGGLAINEEGVQFARGDSAARCSASTPERDVAIIDAERHAGADEGEATWEAGVLGRRVRCTDGTNIAINEEGVQRAAGGAAGACAAEGRAFAQTGSCAGGGALAINEEGDERPIKKGSASCRVWNETGTPAAAELAHDGPDPTGHLIGTFSAFDDVAWCYIYSDLAARSTVCMLKADDESAALVAASSDAGGASIGVVLVQDGAFRGCFVGATGQGQPWHACYP